MFVGRTRELGELNAALTDCAAGHGRMLLVGGEPGIGKTQLLATWAAQVSTPDLRLYWGRCREEGGTPVHWPWVQVLRAVVRATDRDALDAALGSGTPSIVTAMPELAARIAPTEPAPAAPIAPDRFTFFNAVRTFLRRLAAPAPLVLIFDDLHAADPSSLALLEFVSTELEGTRLLLLATYREHEAADDTIAAFFTRLATHGDRLHLDGLPVDGVRDLLAHIGGAAVPAQQLAAVYAATEGNPLFTQELARALAARGRLGHQDPLLRLELPDSVEHVLATRLAPLSDMAREVLSTAAVIGRSFEVATIEAVTGIPAAALDAAMEEAAAAGIVSLSPDAGAEAAFTHAIYREFFFGSLTLLQRAGMHLSVARLLEERDAEAHLPDIAFHLQATGPLGDPHKAVAYSQRAGDQARSRLAYAQGARHYEDALRALDACPRDDSQRCDLLLRLGDARFRAGESDAGKHVLRQAAELARALGDGARFAHATLAVAGPWVLAGGGVRDDVVRLLEQSLLALPAGNDDLRAMVLARLAIELQFVDLSERPLMLAEEAIAIARRIGDAKTLVEGLLGRHAAVYRRDPDSLPTRLALARELVTLTRQIGAAELDFRGRFHLIFDLLHVGDRRALESEMAAAEQLAERMHQPMYDWIVAVWRATRAMIDGQLDTAEELVESAFAMGSRALGADELILFALQVHTAQRLVVRRDRGRGLEELLPIHRQVAEMVPLPLARVMVALLCCDLEQWNDARDELERVAAGDFANIPGDSLWLMSHAWLAEICAALGDHARARLLYDRLYPYAAEQFSNGNVYCGSISFYLGVLAASLERASDAVTHFTTAQRHHRRMGARCWITRTQLHHGALLYGQPGARERRRGRALLEQALSAACALGMADVAAQAERWRLQAGQADRAAAVSPPAIELSAPMPHILRRRGDY